MGFYKNGKYIKEPTDVGYNNEWTNPKKKKEKKMSKQLTYDECDVLIDALEVWINKGQTSQLMGDLMAGALGGMDEELGNELEEKQKREKEKFEQKKRERKRIATQLKAKLYDIQDNAEVLTDES